MTAVTGNTSGGLFPPEFFHKKETQASPGPHALSIAARIMNDPELAYGKGADSILNKHCNEWSPEGDFAAKHEELVWLVTAIYGFSGWRKGKAFKANFYT